MPGTLPIRSLRHVALRCPDLEAARRFYTDAWGLEVVTADDVMLTLRGTGDEHHVLALRLADDVGLDHVAFGVATPAEIDLAAAHLIERGVSIEDEPGQWSHPGGGYAMAFRDPEGRRIVLVAEVASVAPRSGADARPIGLSHVVFNTVDLDAAVAFWTGVVGMRVSDWSERQMAFLRCDARHHSIAFNQHPWTSVNHVAYDVADLDDFMRSIGRLRHAGFTPLWGPGRHGPGNNAFAYFGDPIGYVPEVTCGLTEIDEASWLPRVWQRVPDQSDLWGTAGPPPPELRQRMGGAPDSTSPAPGAR